MTEKKTVAEQLFDMEREFRIFEDSVFDKILVCLNIDPEEPNDWPLDGWVFDEYDYSFELTQVQPGWEPTEQQLNKCWQLGFVQCWINYTDGTEKRYAKL